MEVVVLTIEHEYGVDTWAFSTMEKAQKRLVAWVRDWLGEEIEDPAPEDDSDAIDSYFGRVVHQSYTCRACVVDSEESGA